MASAAVPQPAAVAAPGSQARDEYETKASFFSDFLHGNREKWEKLIDTELANGRYRIPLELRDLQKYKAGLDQDVLQEPIKFMLPWEDALLSFLRDYNEKAVKALKQPLKLDLRGSFGRNHQTPRGMRSTVLQNLMCVEGIVCKTGLITPKMLTSIHVSKDDDGGHVEARDHRDATAFVNQPERSVAPHAVDQEGNELQVEIGLSVYKDYQKFTVQEAPEQAPHGQIPRSVDVICEGDLTDKVKPGDRVQVTGVYTAVPPPPPLEFTTGVFPSRIIATNITAVKDMIEPAFVPDDLVHIRELAARPDAFQVISRSFAPSICGHEKVKMGLLLQMVGGTEKATAHSSHIRGDIHVLLIGDPSCGKSQMMRFVMRTAPLAISTTGRGSSGVGLTAAMIRDPTTREFALEAGAMVLADRGTICIDEFDKMGNDDRVAIHEAMEQQCVSISKAGMHVTLNAHCSVVAAANPVYGSFDPSLDLAKNINMPDSILSRFDLVFVVRDITTEEIDRKIATQVLRQASQRHGGSHRGAEQIYHSSIVERREEVDRNQVPEASEVFEKTLPGPDGEPAPQVLTVDFLRKYIRYCKRFEPVLGQAAQAVVAEKYVDMRMRFQSGFADLSNPDSAKKPMLAVTTRTLEALIRLSTAHAKLKLRKDEVLPEDVLEAYKLMLAAREEDVPEASGEAEELPPPDNNDGDDGDEGGAAQSQGQKRKRDELDNADIAPTRLSALTVLLARTFHRQQVKQMPKEELLEALNAGLSAGEAPFGEAEFAAGLEKLEERNKVMVDESGIVIEM